MQIRLRLRAVVGQSVTCMLAFGAYLGVFGCASTRFDPPSPDVVAVTANEQLQLGVPLPNEGETADFRDVVFVKWWRRQPDRVVCGGDWCARVQRVTEFGDAASPGRYVVGHGSFAWGETGTGVSGIVSLDVVAERR
jgi:hypothetical protein